MAKIKAIIIGLFLGINFLVFSNEYKTINAPIWVYYESMPGNDYKSKELQLEPSLEELKEIGQFVISGMLFGFEFVYTPSDKLRNVSEYYELKLINSIELDDENFYITDLSKTYPRLNAWARYTLKGINLLRYERQTSVSFTSSFGVGEGERSLETNGVFKAYELAIVNAVRNLAQQEEKNKPKEVRGELIIKEAPRVYLSGGFFIVNIRANIMIKEIIPYSIF